MQRDQYRDWVRVPIRWSDMDAYQHVNNARYMSYMEAGRIHLFEQIVLENWQTAPSGPVLVSLSCNFRQPVTYPAVLDVGTCVVKIGRTSFELQHNMFLENTDALVADATSTVVWVSRASGAPTELGDELRRRLELFSAPNP